ncbi:hypothetical protein [Atopobium fossor]|uniref:hypothetical protein n=1 Tax=Atopobium fossor TaxID=39487 RepID=UPI000409B5ED|nr:hypothetical protein [Atopobium fossor]
MSSLQRQFKISCLTLLGFGLMTVIFGLVGGFIHLSAPAGTAASLVLGALSVYYGYNSAMAANVPAQAVGQRNNLGMVLVLSIIVIFAALGGSILGQKIPFMIMGFVLAVSALICIMLCNKLAKEVDR